MRKELRAGDVAVAPLPGGGFGACQVSGITDEAVTVHALDWFSPEPPDLDDLRDAGPVPLAYRGLVDRLAQISVFRSNSPMPPDFDWIGNLPVPPGVPDHVNAYSGWASPFGDMARQRHWDERVPAETKAAFRAARESESVTADLGAGPVTLPTSTSSLHLTSGTIPVPATGPVDWTILDLLPRCAQVLWAGPDRGLTEALTRHPLVTDLHWSDAPPVVDLRATEVRSLRVAGDSLREIRLPSAAHRLSLGAARERVTVRAADDGRWLDLELYQVTPSTRAPSGLTQVRSVSLTGDGVLSAATLAGFAAAHTLELRWTAPPGRLDDPSLLLHVPSLQLVEMFEAYGVDADITSSLPALRHLSIYGLRGSVARELRARLRRTDVELSLRGAKTDSWLAANLDNPFRDWADDDTRAGAAACKAYATALRAIDKLAAAAPAAVAPASAADAAAAADAVVSGAEAILRELIDKLHAIDEKYEFIDTIRREEAGDAFAELAARARVPSDLAADWFDEWRDF
ncbi:hypothetical protein QLQ12_43670 [Actinoplanes sp. NEAU-A12]|uniref:Uncharacterized protein n=1 Tax=Actinoplanes sandaracinus TaxID=3045177 RepID=A0ABT6X0I5_9ACTN|nr:hypothetical protein [Actinoplanes sandaracinus]MDI6105503.1 hypothetical protein [Actinoplanes sandaracinus]